MRLAPVVLLASLSLSLACLPDNPTLDDDGESGETGETGGELERVEDGLLGCPAGEACTIVAVSQTIDDRVELYTGAGPGPRYRGALDLDLKPNPGGDISGELLDEPYGLAWDGLALHVLVGHYPTRELGSLLSFPIASLEFYELGATVPSGDWFLGNTDTQPPIRLAPLDRTEPLSLIARPDGALLVSVFANDLMLPDGAWTVASELLAVTYDFGPNQTQVDALALDCAGAWSIVALDDDADAVALACDGDEALAIVDVDPLAQRCVADVLFSDKRVRYLAPDGLGGVIVGEHPAIASANEDARIWWFDGDCQTRGFTVLDAAVSWELRELVAIPSELGPRWLLARADGDERGVLILAGDPAAGTVEVCGRVAGLDAAGAWTASGGASPLRPHALALTRDGLGLAVGVGPATYDNAGPGYGAVWWVSFDDAEDPCDRVAVETVELSAEAPAVDPMLPQTWRRAPDVVELIEVAP